MFSFWRAIVSEVRQLRIGVAGFFVAGIGARGKAWHSEAALVSCRPLVDFIERRRRPWSSFSFFIFFFVARSAFSLLTLLSIYISFLCSNH